MEKGVPLDLGVIELKTNQGLAAKNSRNVLLPSNRSILDGMFDGTNDMINKLMVSIVWLVSIAELTSAFGDELRQKPALLNVQIRVEMQYLIYLPVDYAEQKSWPLMLFLHGSGRRGSNLEFVARS